MGEIPTKPRKPEEPDILDQIVVMLEENGKVEQKTRDNLLLKALMEVIRRVRCIDDIYEKIDLVEKNSDERMDRFEKSAGGRMDVLERRNIATMFIRHPYVMIALTILLFIFLNLLAHSFSINTLLIIILNALGIPIPKL